MNNIQTDLNRSVAGFVAQVTELARRAAIDTLEAALTGTGATRARAGSPLAAPRASGRGIKRDPAALEALTDRVRSFIAANPGLRIEQINKELGTKTKELALPIRKLLADGAVTSKGQKRSTTYFPGKRSKKN